MLLAGNAWCYILVNMLFSMYILLVVVCMYVDEQIRLCRLIDWLVG